MKQRHSYASLIKARARTDEHTESRKVCSGPFPSPLVEKMPGSFLSGPRGLELPDSSPEASGLQGRHVVSRGLSPSISFACHFFELCSFIQWSLEWKDRRKTMSHVCSYPPPADVTEPGCKRFSGVSGYKLGCHKFLAGCKLDAKRFFGLKATGFRSLASAATVRCSYHHESLAFSGFHREHVSEQVRDVRGTLLK